MDSIWVILSLSSWYYCVNLSHNVIIIMILLFLFGARCHYHDDIIGAQWGNLMIPLYDIIVFLFLGFFSKRWLTPHLTGIYSPLWFPTHSESTPEICIINSIQPSQKPYPPPTALSYSFLRIT